jgi:hypothetical protein
MTSAQPAAKAATETIVAPASFDEQLRQARALVGEGRRLLRTGTVLVRRSHQRLTDTEAYFRRTVTR